MIAISTIFLLFILSTCNGRDTFDDECSKDTIDFGIKVKNSSFVVFGKSRQKALDQENESIFHVTFQVDCIFKGLAIPRLINITQAGQVESKMFCQEFPVGSGHIIAFLERNPLNLNDTNTFIPADFVEVPYVNNVTNILLTNTCGLHRLLPVQSSALMSDVCPIVSTAPHCITLESTSSGLHPIVIPNGSKNGIDNIRSKSGIAQIQDTKNGVNSINISILLILMAITFIRLN